MIQLKPGLTPSSLNRPRSKSVRTAARVAKKKSKGLRFDRVFSDADVAPFDQIDWERRTAEITDDSGKVIFKQENIEVPKSWSALATKIAVSKYFYGDIANGTNPHQGGRETSVRQLVHRVTRTIADWGIADGYFAAHGRGVLEDFIGREIAAAERVLYLGDAAVAFVPACARYPYEVWVAPLEPLATFGDLDERQRRDLARALKTVLLKYDGLWDRPFPYLMAWYQAPTDGKPHPGAHLHAEFYPPYRTRDRLKYLAGTELAAGWFAMDALPEDKARELQAVRVDIDAQ